MNNLKNKSNKYGIPSEDLKNIRERDKDCVYCHKKMIEPSGGGWRGDWATIEHLNYLPPWNNPNTVAICCGSCNSSRGVKKLLDWFESEYCIKKNINKKTVTKPVQEYIIFIENFIDELSWTFAKTMPEIPHYYVVKENLPSDKQDIFNAFDKYIKNKGYSNIFDLKSYSYLNIGNYKYWIIGNILNRAEILSEKNVKR